MGASWVLPSTITTQEQSVVHSRKHISFSSKITSPKIHIILSTFLGGTQEAHMCVSWVIPSVTSLTERSVYSHHNLTSYLSVSICFQRNKSQTKRSFEIVRVIFKKSVKCDFIQVSNPLCAVLSNSACSLLFIRSIRDFQGTSSHLQAGILS